MDTERVDMEKEILAMVMKMNGTTLTAVRDAAERWVRGREIELLKEQIYSAMFDVTTTELIKVWGDYDPDTWAEKLRDGWSDLADVDTAVLAYFIEQYKDEWGVEP